MSLQRFSSSILGLLALQPSSFRPSIRYIVGCTASDTAPFASSTNPSSSSPTERSSRSCCSIPMDANDAVMKAVPS